MDFPHRKHPRLKNMEYTEPGYYFITVCTKNTAHTLGDASPENGTIILTPAGEITKHYIEQINTAYPNIYVDKYYSET